MLGAYGTEYAILIAGGEVMREQWNITAKKKMLEKDMSLKELSAILNINYSLLSSVLNGRTVREQVKDKVCEYLRISGR